MAKKSIKAPASRSTKTPVGPVTVYAKGTMKTYEDIMNVIVEPDGSLTLSHVDTIKAYRFAAGQWQTVNTPPL